MCTCCKARAWNDICNQSQVLRWHIGASETWMYSGNCFVSSCVRVIDATGLSIVAFVASSHAEEAQMLVHCSSIAFFTSTKTRMQRGNKSFGQYGCMTWCSTDHQRNSHAFTSCMYRQLYPQMHQKYLETWQEKKTKVAQM